MRILAGESSEVHFTHLSQSSRDALNASFTEETALASASCFQEGVLDRINASNLSINDVCLLDPKADQELAPADGDGRFKWFLFGVRFA